MGRKQADSIPSPLAEYRKRLDMTQEQLAELVTVARGYSCLQSAVSRWESGRVSRANMAHIETATGGEVSAADWARWRKRVRAKRQSTPGAAAVRAE